MQTYSFPAFNEPVRHATVALASCHLVMVPPDFEINLWRHMNLVLQSLEGNLEAPNAV